MKDKHESSNTGQKTICVDMHCHSNFSDGTMAPEQLVKKLFHSGVKYAALTDHDTLAGLPSFRQALSKYGIGFITGIEISALNSNYLIHLLAYGFDPEHPALNEMIANGKKSSRDTPYNVTSRRFYSAVEVIKIIHDAGGMAILAHPFQTEPDIENLKILIEELKKLGLDGIEAFYGPDPQEVQHTLLQIAKKLNLIATAGTDYHKQDWLAPGMHLEISKWKDFRNGLLQCSMHAQKKKNPPLPKNPIKIKNQWFSFIFRIILPAALSLLLFIITLFMFFLPYFENTLMDRKRDSIRELTQVALSVLNEAETDVQNGKMSLEQAQELAKNHIRALRYGSENKDYFWLQDLSPRILMHPYRPDLEGEDVSDFVDNEGTRIFVLFSEVVQETGEGYVSYVWQWKDDFERLEPKESYISLFKPWGWVIGTGIYVNDVEDEIAKLRFNLVIVSLAILLIVLVLLIYMVRQGLLLEKSRSNAEKLLNESIERYRALSEAATEGALFVYEGRCRYANTVFTELLGCPSSGLELLDLDDIFPDIEENKEWRKYLYGNKSDQLPRNIHGILRRCDGSDINCIFTIRNDNNSRKSFMVLVRRAGEYIEHKGTHIALHRLLQLPDSLLTDLTESIRQATKISEVTSLCKKTPDFVFSLLENGTSSIALTHMISNITDMATQKIIDLCFSEIGPPPVPYAFLALGSHGRQTQTLYSDQDNAIVYKLEGQKDEKEIEKYFLELATRVCDTLEEAGYQKCRGGKIASNPQWCKPLSVWKNYFAEWIQNCEPQQVVDFSIFFDLRAIAGEPEIVSELRHFIYDALRETPFFLSQVAQNALLFKTPMRLLGTIFSSGGKDHPGRIDVKIPAMAIVSFARLYALKNNVHETNTLLRLDAIKRLGIILDSKHRNLVTVYETLLRLRLWNQALAIEQNRELDNWIDPAQLGHMEEVILKECFNEIDELQNFIQRDFFG